MTEMAKVGFALADDPQAAMQDALARHTLVGRFGQPSDIDKRYRKYGCMVCF